MPMPNDQSSRLIQPSSKERNILANDNEQTSSMKKIKRKVSRDAYELTDWQSGKKRIRRKILRWRGVEKGVEAGKKKKKKVEKKDRVLRHRPSTEELTPTREMDAYSYAYEKEEHLCYRAVQLVSPIQIQMLACIVENLDFKWVSLSQNQCVKFTIRFALKANYDDSVRYDAMFYIEIKTGRAY